MSAERDPAALLREAMTAEAGSVTATAAFTERVLATAQYPPGIADGQFDTPDGPNWRGWLLPAAAAAVVAVLLAAVLIGTSLVRSDRQPPASRTTPAPSLSSGPPAPSISNSTSRPAPSASSSPSPGPSSGSTSGGGSTASGPSGGSALGPAGGPVPAGFTGYDLTWVSEDDGWALGTAPCGSPPCTSVLRTTDGGRSWVGIPAPRAELVETDTNTCGDGCGRVGYLRFATPLIGYAYGPNSLYMTTDGGATWKRKPGFAYGLEVVGGSVLRVSAQAAGCEPGCTFRLQRAPIGSDSWQDVPLPAGGRSARAQLATSGNTVVLATHANAAGGAEDATSVLFTSSDGGGSWHTVGEPCPRRGTAEVDSQDVTVAPDGSITVLCVPRGPLRDGTVFPMTSADGEHFTAGTPVPGPRPPTALGATSATDLFVLKDLDGLYRSTDAGAHWTRLPAGPPGGSYLGFESSRVGRVVINSESGTNGTWTTRDGGTTWTFSSFG
jgi:hypothetical protein